MTSTKDTVVIRQGTGARIAVTALAFLMAIGFFSEITDNFATQSIVASLSQLTFLCFVILFYPVVGWSTVAFDGTTVRSHVPFVAKQAVDWENVTSYRIGWQSNALLVNGSVALVVPALLPKATALWEECERRGIPCESKTTKPSG